MLVHQLVEEANCRCPLVLALFFFFYLPFSPSRAPGGDHTCADAHGARQRRVPQRRQAGVGPSGCTAQASPPASRAKGARGAALPRVTRVRERRSSERPHPSGHTQRTSGGARRASARMPSPTFGAGRATQASIPRSGRVRHEHARQRRCRALHRDGGRCARACGCVPRGGLSGPALVAAVAPLLPASSARTPLAPLPACRTGGLCPLPMTMASGASLGARHAHATHADSHAGNSGKL